MAFAACTQNEVEEFSAHRADVPETLTVGFEGGDTRIELNEALKTVWTEGDEVSAFYQSYENTRWVFQGATGDRLGELRLVSGDIGQQTMDNIIVAYPYDANYRINIENRALHASLPAVQSYKNGSYGAEGNIMVAESEFTQFVLKSVCGWLRIELTGEGESVRAITLRGNAGEQVAGLCYIDTADASVTLASKKATTGEDGEVAGNINLDDSVLTKVTLDCGSGVTLGSGAKSFYIGLLPQTFEEGITVEVECGNGTSTTKSTADKLVVERNHIVPMASFKYDGVLPEVYELAYATNDGMPLDPYTTESFGSEFVENIYDAATGRGALKFAGAITAIPKQAFIACNNLTWIDLPEGITTIGNEAFNGCVSMQEIVIPASTKSVGTNAFKGCQCKATINCTGISFQGVDFTEVIIGDNVTTIGGRAFQDCKSLTSVTIGDSVTTIGSSAFYSCNSLTSVTIPDSVTSIGSSTFYGCSSLTNVTIPDSVTTIGNDAFRNCTSLTSVVIPNSVTSIGWNTFYDCSSLTKATIGNRVTLIGSSTFYGCSSLTSVTIGNRVTGIENSAFKDCSNLTSVVIPGGVTTIGNYAFRNCTSLTSVVIPDSVTSIGSYAFYNCSSLTNATIGNRVTSIVSYTFYGCSSLTNVTIPDSVMTIGDYAFCECTSLTSVTIGDSVTTIGDSAFSNCDSLTSVTIPDSVTTIGNNAFYVCESLTSVTIPDSVTTIGDYAFYGCLNITAGSSLTSVYCKATTPPSLGSYMFMFKWNGSNTYIGCKIYVPAEAVKTYRFAAGWRTYANYIVGYDFETGEVVE